MNIRYLLDAFNFDDYALFDQQIQDSVRTLNAKTVVLQRQRFADLYLQAEFDQVREGTPVSQLAAPDSAGATARAVL